MPEGASLDEREDGSVAITGAKGEFLGGFNAPWAKTAQGGAVPTCYEVEGNTLVQEVDHRALPESVHPVVADPWLGRDLMYQPWVMQDPRGYVINVDPTYNLESWRPWVKWSRQAWPARCNP
ncbi:hypothetical protein [Streptomyces luteolus]|uniref:Uncharacterized protein n=1 Tax=Streptomyces luteolus TaxID=3043615 RepID=A0ABT6T4G9_9ACTN|nr:hypothetical protein [Streptomyces sp. B-S-A12]MDI3422540.1 hypothetical protein [Streptomyces sp. B-S-A12]